MGGKESLDELRRDLAQTTLGIISLCGERMLLAKKIGETKAENYLPVENLSIEEELKGEALKVCREYGMDEGFCLKILELLLKESKRIQHEVMKPKSGK